MVTMIKRTDSGESQLDGVINTAAVAAAVKKNASGLAVLKKLSGRQRGKAYVTVERAIRDTEAVPQECQDLFEALARAGAGKFKIAKNWKHSTFYWHTKISDTATAILRELKSGNHKQIALSDLPPAAARPPKSAPAFVETAAQPKRAPGRPAKTSPLPRILAPTTPVIEALEGTASAAVSAQPGGGEGSILVQIRGMEFELDLTKVPAELLKFRRML